MRRRFLTDKMSHHFYLFFFFLDRLQEIFTLSGWTGLSFLSPIGLKQVGLARFGLNKIGPGRAARMPTPVLDTLAIPLVFFRK